MTITVAIIDTQNIKNIEWKKKQIMYYTGWNRNHKIIARHSVQDIVKE